MTKITTDKQGVREIIILLTLFACIDFWIFFICLLSLGKQSVLAWFIAILLSILIDWAIYLYDTIYSIEEEAFIVKKRWSKVFKNSRFLAKEECLKAAAVFHAVIDVGVNPVHYSHVIHVKLQIKESKGGFLNFAILKDKNFESFIQFLSFLRQQNISYTILKNKNRKLNKILGQQDIPLSFKSRA